ncbi:MAG TPA: ABC transporter ATP-binding protein [Dissulfurispiraceae bacterium]|nr:ABC transporter ATP-binding protein [Dissulfurispiraceae bacterium]
MLEVRDVTKTFGGLRALDNVSFDVPHHSITALIGPNGAGKTTMMNIISGIFPPDSGSVSFHGVTISGTSPSKIAKQGLSRTFQHLELFSDMTVLENVMVGRYIKGSSGFVASGLHLPSVRREERENRRIAIALLEDIGLAGKQGELAKNLPLGEQRILEIGRALATEPVVLLLDEPAAGLNIRETRNLGNMIIGLNSERGITILLVEHDMDLVMRISTEIHVLNFGQKIAAGKPEEIQRNRDVITAYLGEEDS